MGSLARSPSLSPSLAIPAAPMHIVLFGAGHVGHALVALFAHLPCVVEWIDVRDACFPDEVPPNVQPEPTDTPAAVVAAAPPGSYFLVMTHDHTLDFALAEQILRRDDFAYFGMIGSRTKRVRFERRLAERGVARDHVADMVCPIGVSGIVDKAPAAIAVAVCAELLQARTAATRLWRKGDRACDAEAATASLAR